MRDEGGLISTEEQGRSRSSPDLVDIVPEEGNIQELANRNRELEKQVDRLTKELRRHQRYIASSRKMFLPQFLDSEKVKAELRRLRKEKLPLQERREQRHKSLLEVSMRNVEKVDEVRRLTARISTLMVGQVVRKEDRIEIPLAGEEEEREDARQKFPEEIWEEFFGKLKDPRDLWNCFNTCHLFQKILHPWKSTWALQQALPYLFPYLSGHKLLECRLVSRGWKEGVDEFLQDHPSLCPHIEETCNPRHLSFVNPMMQKGLDEVSHFTFNSSSLSDPPNFGDPEWNSKIHRSLALGRAARLVVEAYGVSEDDQNEQIWSIFYQFLETFGKDIYYLDFVGFQQTPTSSASHLTGQKIFQFFSSDLFVLAPNLRKLNIENLPHIAVADIVSFGPINIPELPPAPHLESLESDSKNSASLLILIFTLKHHVQLGRLKEEQLPWSVIPGFAWQWPKLTELHITVNDLGVLSSLAGMNFPKLAKLRLSFSNMTPEGEPLQLTDVFLALREVLTATRVTTLRLDESIYQIKSRPNEEDQQPPPTIMMPPTLKTLELENKKGIIPHPKYQLLIPHFLHLENLNVFYRDNSKSEVVLRPRDKLKERHDGQLPTEVEREQARLDRELEVVEVNKFLYTGEMYKSNIWELLPRLKVFTFQWEVYTRGGYEDYCSRKKRRIGEKN